MVNKNVHRTTAIYEIFVKMRPNNIVSNDKLSCTLFLIKVLLIRAILQSKIIPSVFDTKTAYDYS